MKRATLEQIAIACGKPTGDELRAQIIKEDIDRVKKMRESEPIYMNSRQRRNYKKYITRLENTRD